MKFDFPETVADGSTIPEEYKGLYVEANGSFTLAENVRGLAKNYVSTETALERARADKTTASNESAQRRQALKAFEDAAAELGIEVGDDLVGAFKAHFSALTDQVKGGKDIKIDLEKIKNDHQRVLTEAINNKDKEVGLMRGTLERYLVDMAAEDALKENKARSITMLMPLIKNQVKVVQDGDSFVPRVVDAQGDFRSDGRGGFMNVRDLVKEMKGNSEFAPAFESESPAGTGTKPGTTTRQPPKQGDERSSTDKIAAGLAARK